MRWMVNCTIILVALSNADDADGTVGRRHDSILDKFLLSYGTISIMCRLGSCSFCSNEWKIDGKGVGSDVLCNETNLTGGWNSIPFMSDVKKYNTQTAFKKFSSFLLSFCQCEYNNYENSLT